jgi:hypothetical protein
MLDLPRYLLGVLEVALLAGFATFGAAALRAKLLPAFSGAPAHLATAVVALALLLWTAEILGSFGLFKPLPYLVAVAAVGSGLWLRCGGGWGCPSRAAASCFSHKPVGERDRLRGEKPSKREGHPHPPPHCPRSGSNDRGVSIATLIALAVAATACVKFGLDAKPKLTTGMTGFDSTWYHGPFAAGLFQSGNTWDLHFIAPQFLAWFYPVNAEIFHAVGMLAFGRDVLSPLLNLGWFAGCLVACWCIGRPYQVAPWSLALGAIALSLPVLSDQAGEARNDIAGIFFLLAAVAVAINAWAGGRGALGDRHAPSQADPTSEGARANDATRAGEGSCEGEEGAPGTGVTIVVGLAAGLAAGTKLNFLLPAAVLVLGLALVVPASRRWRALAAGGLAALAGGGYWYLRNLAHAGNPLPWFDSLGPISLPAPDQALGGREGHSVLGYLTDGSVWSDWFLPGLHDGLTLLWPLLGALAVAGLLLCLGRRSSPVLRVAGAAGLAAAFAWLIAPTSASGPEGMPRGFESGLRYLVPAVVLGLALLPATPPLAKRPRSLTSANLHLGAYSAHKRSLVRVPAGGWLALAGLAVVAIAIGYPVQRHYLANRYANPTFAAPGLSTAFAWVRGVDHARIATTSTRQYPLYGAGLSNHVQYIGDEQPHGGFTPATTCEQWRRLLNEGNYDFVVTSRDRIEGGKPQYPESTRWTEGPGAEAVLRKPPTVVFKLKGSLAPSACP